MPRFHPSIPEARPAPFRNCVHPLNAVSLRKYFRILTPFPMIPSLLRVLMIGNSFSVCVGNQMPQIVQSIPGYELELTSAYIGGCSFERHWNNVTQTEKDPEKKQYQVKTWVTHGEDAITSSFCTNSINELIAQDSWDVITIQQASPSSWKYETYQPYADNLVSFIHEKAPKAKIWIQQTWAYRADDSRIMPGGAWGFDQAGMHERVVSAYDQLADHLQAPLIPTGNAVALFRQRVEKPFVPLTPEERAALKPHDKPDCSGDVAGSFSWGKGKGPDAPLTLRSDTIHLNGHGHYLQACTWFLRLYGVETFPDSVYAPDWMTPERAKLLRSCAEDAVRTLVEKEKASTK